MLFLGACEPLLQPKVAHYYMSREIGVRPGRPYAPVTLQRMTSVAWESGSETRGIDVTSRAESIFDIISSWGGLYVPQPDFTPLSRCVTFCHAPVTALYGKSPYRMLCNLRLHDALPASYLLFVISTQASTVIECTSLRHDE